MSLVDTDDSNTIDQDEIIEWVAFGDAQDADVARFLKEVDRDGDGKIALAELQIYIHGKSHTMKFGEFTEYLEKLENRAGVFSRKLKEQPVPVVVAPPRRIPASCDHVSLSLQCGLKPGKTLADMQELYSKELPVANDLAGCLHFQLYMNQQTLEDKNSLLCETYASAADHMALNEQLMAKELVEGPSGIFATYDFTKITFSMSQAQYDTPGYANFLAGFQAVTPNPLVINIHDFPGKLLKSWEEIVHEAETEIAEEVKEIEELVQHELYPVNEGPGSIVGDKICPVSYMGAKGPHSADVPHVHEGHIYHFTNADVVQMFKAKPEKFLPEFGGFCATALSMGVKAPVDWSLFLIEELPRVHNNPDAVPPLALYLFHTKDAKSAWESDPSLKVKAHQNWIQRETKPLSWP